MLDLRNVFDGPAAGAGMIVDRKPESLNTC